MSHVCLTVSQSGVGEEAAYTGMDSCVERFMRLATEEARSPPVPEEKSARASVCSAAGRDGFCTRTLSPDFGCFRLNARSVPC